MEYRAFFPEIKTRAKRHLMKNPSSFVPRTSSPRFLRAAALRRRGRKRHLSGFFSGEAFPSNKKIKKNKKKFLTTAYSLCYLLIKLSTRNYYSVSLTCRLQENKRKEDKK